MDFGGAGKKYFTDSAGGYTELEWMQAAGPWEIKQQVGTWSFEP